MRWRTPLIICAIIFYLLPLFQFGRFMASYPGDPYAHAASLAWFCQNAPQGIWHQPNLFTPTGVNLALTYDHPLLTLLTCPVSGFGPIAQFNLLALIQVTLIISVSIIIATRFLKQPWLRLAFIFLYSFSTFYQARANQHLNLLTLVWSIPLIFLLFYELNLKSLRSTLIAFSTLGLSFLCSWTTLPILTPLVAMLLLYHLWSTQKPHQLIPALIHLGLGASLTLIIFLFGAWPMLESLRLSPPLPDLDRAAIWNADLVSYLIPFKFHTYFPLFRPWYQAIVTIKTHYFEPFLGLDPGLVLLAGFILFKYRRRLRLFLFDRWLLLLAIFYGLLSFGPVLTVLGRSLVNLPYYSFLASLPPFSINRSPARYGSVVIFALTLLLLRWLDRYLSHKAILVGIYALITTTILAHNSQFPHFNYQEIFPFRGLNLIATDPAPVMVLHLPTAVQNDQSQNLLQYYHRHPIPTGYISYLAQTPQTLMFLANDPALSHLSCANHIFPYTLTPLLANPGQLIQHLKSLNFKYLILNRDYLKLPECQAFAHWATTTLIPSANLTLLDSTPAFAIYQII